MRGRSGPTIALCRLFADLPFNDTDGKDGPIRTSNRDEACVTQAILHPFVHVIVRQGSSTSC